jgi:hypothetical protein
MPSALLAILQLGSVSVTGFADPEMAEPSAAVKSCIATHAPGVERTIDSLNEGADFLVQKVCIGPIADQAAEAGKKRADDQKERQKAACEEMQKDAAAQPAGQTTGAARRQSMYMSQMCDPATQAIYDTADFSSYIYMQAAGSAPKATSLAAQTLLQLRMARTKPR